MLLKLLPDILPCVIRIRRHVVDTRGRQTFILLYRPISCKDKDCATTRLLAGKHIHAPVADNKGRCKRDVMLVCGLRQHPCLRFATGAYFLILNSSVLGMVRAIVHTVQVSAVFRQFRTQAHVDALKVLFGQ